MSEPTEPVDHLVRGLLPGAVVETLDAKTETTTPAPTQEPSGSPCPEGSHPTEDIKLWEVLPKTTVVVLQDFGKNSQGLHIWYGMIENLLLDQVPAMFSFAVCLLLADGMGTFKIDLTLEHSKEKDQYVPILDFPHFDITCQKGRKLFLYQQAVNWDIQATGTYRIVARSRGRILDFYPFYVMPRSVK